MESLATIASVSLFMIKLTVLLGLLSFLDGFLLAMDVVFRHVAALALALGIVALVCVHTVPSSLVAPIADVATFAHLFGVVVPVLVGTLVVLELSSRAHALVLQLLTVRLSCSSLKAVLIFPDLPIELLASTLCILWGLLLLLLLSDHGPHKFGK